MNKLGDQLAKVFTNSFLEGKRFETIIEARKFAEPIVKEKIDPGTLTAKLVDESIERGIVQAARQLVCQTPDSVSAWEQCLNLYDRQPALNTRTSTSVLQQAYSTPVPIAYLAGKLADITQESVVYEPTAGNGALLLLANPGTAIVNELNSERAAALRQQGFTVTEQDASVFSPRVEPIDRIITNPPFGSVKDAHGQTRTFRQGLLTTSQIDHAIALKALDLMKPDGKAVLILGGKMGNEQSRTQRYNTQLTRGFYRWLYKDADYKVADHFSIAGSLYRKQGTSFPIDIVLIDGKGETDLKLPGVQPPRIYDNYSDLKEVLLYAIQQQSTKQVRDTGIALQRVSSGQALDAGTTAEITRNRTAFAVDNSISPLADERNRDIPGISFSPSATTGVADPASAPGLATGVRTTGGERSISMASQGNINLSAKLPESSRSSPHPSAMERVFGDELQRTPESTLSNLDTAVSSKSAATRADELGLHARHEPERLAGLDELRRQSVPSTVNAMSTTEEPKVEPLQEELDNQVPYTPRSKAKSLGTLAPAATLKGLENVFDKIEAVTRLTVDEYVQSRLNEPSLDELFKHYAAEQIDSLALSLYNYEYERKATLIGHDTGIGKTRIVCGLARYAQQQGLTPVIVTADPVLYSDILARDAVDTGNSFNPLLTNNGMKLTLKSPDGEEIGEIRTPNNHIEKIREYTASGDIGEHDSVFTTYGQLTGPSSVERRQLLEALAPRTLLILDESHKAGGASGEQRPKTKAEKAREEKEDYVLSCTDFFQKLVTQTPGFVASSATAIKDPIVAARLFYETTDLKLAAVDQETFTDHLKTGGVPLQQMVFAKWAESGGCIRCEKSYEGVEFSAQTVPVSLETAENNAKILNLIWRFDKIKNGVVREISSELADAGEVARAQNSALGDAGATSTNFTSVLHNLTAVVSLGLKAEETANAVIRNIEQGQKPIVMLFNTMESTIRNFIDTHNELAEAHTAEHPSNQLKRIEVGDAISINAGELFSRYLEKSRTVNITEPYLNEATGKQQTRSYRLTDEELGQIGVAAYNRAAAAITAANWSQLPLSPIDYIKQKVEDAGYSIGEITGRTHILKYESADDIQAGVVTYKTREHSTAQKKQVMDGFQNGTLDAIITNSTTGYSLHASRTVADQRQRVMYLVQPHLDVNQVEQSIGRSHRSGQVDPAKHAPDQLDEQGKPMWGDYPGSFGLPVFKLVVGKDLPTEERAVAILMKKMAHLKANTTGNRSSSFGLKDMPDYVNAYGNEVAQALMQASPELHASLDNPLGYGEELSSDKAIQKVTGRAVMLASDESPTPENPYPSLSRQAWLYDTLSSDYQEFLAQKIALGENDLEAQKLDLQAEPKSRLILSPGEPAIDSPFTKPAYLVEVLAKTGAKPNTTLQVVNAVRGELEFEPIADLKEHDEYERSDVRQKGQEVAQLTVARLYESSDEYLTAHTQARELEISVGQAKVGKVQQKLNAQTVIQTDLGSRLRQAEAAGDTPLAEQLRAQVQQQQPKIEKLQAQLNKAQLDLNGKEFQLAKATRISKTSLEDVSNLLRRFPVGQGVRLTDNATGNSLYGVVAAVEQKGRSHYPATPSNWKLKLLVVDGIRSISLGFDSLLKEGKQSLEPVETAPSFNDSKQDTSVYDLFDERQTEAKEKRYLVSGQVLATELTGKFAQVTDNKGHIHPVYLLKRGFDPVKDLDKKPIQLENSEQIKQFLFDVTEKLGVVQTADENLTIIADIRPANPGGIVLKSPKATSQGGLYFKDEGLLALTGDFVSKTEAVREAGKTKSQSIMTVSVPAEQVDSVLNYVAQKWNVGAASHKQDAKELLGKAVQSWEACDSINPEAEQKLNRTPQVTVIPARESREVNQSVGDPPMDATVQNVETVVSPVCDRQEQIVKRDSSDELLEQGFSEVALFAFQAKEKPHDILINQNSVEKVDMAPLLEPAEQLQSSPLVELLKPPTENSEYPLFSNQPLTQSSPVPIQRVSKPPVTRKAKQPAETNSVQLSLFDAKASSAEIPPDSDLPLLKSPEPLPNQVSISAPIASKEQTAVDGSEALVLPERDDDKWPQVRSYLHDKWGLPPALTDGLYNKGVIYADSSANPVFLRYGGDNWSRDELKGAIVWDASKEVYEKFPSADNKGCFWFSTGKTGKGGELPRIVLVDSPPSAIAHAYLDKVSKISTDINIYIAVDSPKVIPLAEVKAVLARGGQVEVGFAAGPAGDQMAEYVFKKLPGATRLHSVRRNSWGEQSDLRVRDLSKTVSPVSVLNATPKLVSPMQILQQKIDQVDKQTGNFLASLQPSSPSLDTLRQWYRVARESGKSPQYLGRIAEVANQFKIGQPLSEKALSAMSQDLKAHNTHNKTTQFVQPELEP